MDACDGCKKQYAHETGVDNEQGERFCQECMTSVEREDDAMRCERESTQEEAL